MSAVRRRLAGVLVLASLLAGCGPRGDTAEPEPAAEVPVRVAAIETREFRDEIVAPGGWRSSGEVDVVSPGAAVVQSIDVRVGDRVRAGETVAWLETRESAAARQGAELMMQQAHDSTSRAEAFRALAVARRDRIRLPVVVPRGGIVMRRSVEAGGQLAESGEILAIVPADLVVFEARAPASERSRLHPGQAATIAAPGAPAIEASIQRILPVADSIGQTAIVWLAPRRGAALPQLQGFGTAIIAIGAVRKSQAVPDTAVVEDDLTGERRIAVVAAGNRARWMRVALGAGAGSWRELRSPPLPVGTRVIIEGQRGLPDSARVRPAP